MQFAHPIYLWLIPPLLIILIGWYILKQRNARPSLGVSSVKPFDGLRDSWRAYMRHVLFALRMLILACLLVILARPQLKDNWKTTTTEGTDIVLAIDISSTMLGRDFKPNRVSAAKEMASEFVRGRTGDNIGIVVFSGEALTGVPMTIDYATLQNYIESIDVGQLPDGTAIGDGIATAINRLREGKSKSKSIILLTDGSNNTGVVAPVTAAKAAAEYGIKIYAIGVGSEEKAEMPVLNRYNQVEYTEQRVEFDEATLKKVADVTGGKYFRATDNFSLKEIFSIIDKMEKTEIDVQHFSHAEDDYMLFAWIAFALLCLELTLRYTVTRSIP